MLVRIKLLTNLKYAAWDLPGALTEPWVQRDVHERLLLADALVRERSAGRTRILVWDALRSFETQQYLFEREVAVARARHPQLSREALEKLVSNFVRPPRRDRPPPHCTGGAVDVTLALDGLDSRLGRFDDFEETGRADYFEMRPPITAEEQERRKLRDLVRAVMLEVGFVGIAAEWWHYEYGTRYWADQTGNSTLFNSIVEPALGDALAERDFEFPPRQIVDVRGASQFFPSVEARAAALSGATNGFYYARTRHHNERELASQLANLLHAEDAVLLPSGLCAAVSAVAGLMPRNGRLLVDKLSYYETRSSIERLANANGWDLRLADFDTPESIDAELQPGTDVVICDHPRNWLLTTPALSRLHERTSAVGAKLIVDTSVQPTQRLLEQGLADLLVISLSKYPSQGETVAGAVMGAEAVLEPVRRWTRERGILLAPEAAATVLQHLPSLPDRIAAISAKTTEIARFLRRQACIVEVRVPYLQSVGAPCGGQLCCRFTTPQLASAVEAVAGWNSTLGCRFPLGLACTFGAAATTIEHFGSRLPPADGRTLGSDIIEPGWVRLGIGHEPTEDIIAALRFAIDFSLANALEMPLANSLAA